MKKSLAILSVLAAVFGLSSCSSDPAPQASSDPAPQATQTQDLDALSANQTEFSYEGEDGKTALELLQEKADEVGVIGLGANSYVTSINGVGAQESKNEFWALYVDGTPAQTGSGSLVTKAGQTIEWSLETF